MRKRESYQRRVDALYKDQIINELTHRRIEHDIDKLFGKERHTEKGQGIFHAFESYRISYRDISGQAIKETLNVLKTDLIEEMRASEHRIVKDLKKISWNDIASIGSAPITALGTALTIAPYAGVIA